MTANPIRRLLKAKPFVSFSLSLGFETEFTIDDPTRCRLDDEEMILYVSYPEVRPPKFVKRVLEPASVMIVDLRHVTHVSVNEAAMPD
jgi:hypothetical protein